MKISEIYSQKLNHLKTVKFRDDEITVKLFTQKESIEYSELVQDESNIDLFLSKSIYEDGKSLFDSGNLGVFENIPNAHKRELMTAITEANGGTSSFEEKKSD